MKYKKKIFSILENLEKKNIEKDIINIKNLYLQKEKYVTQLSLLKDYQNEYLIKLKSKIELGICLYQWRNYNNFIFILYFLIKDNEQKIKKNQKILEKSLKQYSKNQIKLKTWNYLYKKYKKKEIKKILLVEEMISDEFSQLKNLAEGSCYNV
ncbi:flagellar export protein FliJ [Buchnera aphidicola]|uniref:Flagellar FliJ protein n=1 Tax=Buchnera aphidicola subsp. Schizaphis graminum (strain Sg) TaxID=198804 RepID=FLIJ_BUCAP|nr:flagellar FliJ family protein [Buchnera aphidicola]Q8KA41.1 RecName: Full=Flagellar FliJ protein [Buchnera aphidicola str. Sg (Schizaphis graminum)]AAM67641.1 flagellar FliJ protein [Buchnera aphidicola str. Sg (Schizaphis graminum)]AWI49862.1 flagellar FliJ protein [Buchnera aphidicola (Schizaphis graminum)]